MHLDSGKDPGIFQTHTLANGIRIFHRPFEPAFGGGKVACSVLVLAGGRDDPKGKEGSAHFFEHMPFRGTEAFPSLRDLSETIENNGGYLNAFTTDEATGYEVIVPSTMLEDGIKRIADMLRQPLMRDADIEIERQVILEELRNKRANVMFFARQELFRKLIGEHPLVYAVIGEEAALQSIMKTDLQHFHEQYYNANNTLLFFSGSYDTSQLSTLAEQHFGPLAGGLLHKRDQKPHARTPEAYTTVLTPEGYNRSVYMLGRVLPATDLRQTLLIKLFRDMLARGMTSPLNVEIREKRGLAYNLSVQHTRYEDVSFLMFSVWTQFRQMDEVDTVIWQEVEKILANQARFDEVKNSIKQAALYREYSVGALVDTAIDTFIDYQRLVSLSEFLSELDSITLDEVRIYMKPYLSKSDYVNIRINCDRTA